MFFYFVIYQKFKGGTFIKCLISILYILAETLHSYPEGLEDTPLN